MSRRPRPDLAGRLLAVAVRLLPARRRSWDRAMRAELAAIEPSAARWRFALGCARAVLSRPALRDLRYPLLMAGVLAGAAVGTSRIASGPLRWGLLGSATALLAVAVLGRRQGLLGPVRPVRVARLVRALGYLLTGGLALGFALFMAGSGNQDEQARGGLPVLTVLFACYLLGYLTVTAQRSAATTRALATGAGAGAAAAGVWVLAALAVGPIPTDIAPALIVVGLGMFAAALANSAERHRVGPAVPLAVLVAGMAGLLTIVVAVFALSTWGPPGLIPDLAPYALTPADDLAQSRNEVVDPYVAVLFLGSLVAVALSIVSAVTGRRPAPRAAIRPEAR